MIEKGLAALAGSDSQLTLIVALMEHNTVHRTLNRELLTPRVHLYSAAIPVCLSRIARTPLLPAAAIPLSDVGLPITGIGVE